MNDQNANASSAAPNTPKKKRSWFRRIMFVGIGLAVVLALLVAIAPMIIGGMAPGIAADAVNQQIKGSVTIDEVTLGWGSGQTVRGITVYDPEGNRVASIDRLDTQLSLIGAIFGDLDLGETIGRGLAADIVVAADGSNNLMRTLEPTQPTPPSTEPAVLPPSLGIRFKLVDAKPITITAPDIEKVVIEDLHAELTAPHVTKPITFKLTATPTQGQTRGSLAIDGSIHGAVAPDGTVIADASQLDKLDVTLTAKATDLPVDAVDRLLEQQGVVTATLGKQINLETKLASAEGGRFDVTLTAKSPNLDASADTQLTSAMKASGTARVRLTATPAASAALAKLGAPIALRSDVPVDVNVERFTADLNDVTPANLAATLSVTATGDVPLAGDPTLEGVTVRDLRASVDADSLAGAATVKLNADLVTPEGPGAVKVDGKVDGLFADTWSPDIDNAQVNLPVTLTNVPVALIDRIAGLDGLAVDAAGPLADVETKVTTAEAGRIDITASVKSQRLNAEWSGRVTGDKLHTTGSGKVTQQLTPALAARLATLAGSDGVSITQPVTVTLTIDNLAVTLDDATPANVAINAALATDRDITLTGDKALGDITLTALRGSVETPGLNKAVTLKLTAGAKSAGGAGDININGSVSDLFADTWSPNMQTMKADITAKLNDLPTALVDRVAGLDGLARDALGEKVTLNITSQSTGADAATVDIALRSPRITAAPKLRLDAKANTITLVEPTDVSIDASRALVERFVAPDTGLSIRGDVVRTKLTLSKLEAPLPGETDGKPDPAFQPGKTVIAAHVTEITGADINVDALGPGGVVAIDSADIRLAGPLSGLTIDLTSTTAVRSDAGEYARALGGKLDIALHAETGINPDNSLKPITATLDASAPHLTLNAPTVKLAGDFATAQLNGGKITCTLQPATLTDFQLVESGGVTIAEPLAMNITLTRIETALAEFSLAKVNAAAKVAFDKAVLAGAPDVAGATIRDANTDLSFDGAAGRATVKLTGSATMPGQDKPGPLNVDAVATQLVAPDGALALDTAALDADVKLGGLPTGFVEALTGQSGKLTPVAGKTVTVNATAKLKGLTTPRGTADLKVTTPTEQLTLDAGVNLADVMTLTRPAKLRMRLTPAVWKVWVDPMLTAAAAEPTKPSAPPVALVDSTWVSATIDKLSWPMPEAPPANGVAKTAVTTTPTAAPNNNNPAAPAPSEAAPAPQPIDLSKVALDATLVAEQPLVMEAAADGRRVALTDLRLTARATSLAEPLTVTVDSGVQPRAGADGQALPPSQAEPGKLKVNAVLTDAVTPTLEPNLESLSADLAVNATQLPTSIVDPLLLQQGMLRAALGPWMSANVSAKLNQMDGPVDINLDAMHAKADIKARLDGGFLELREDASMQLTVTEQLSRKFIDHPMLKQVVKSVEPATVVARKQGFRVPLGLAGEPFDLTRVQIDNVTVDPRKMVVKKAGLIKTLLELPTKISSIKQGQLGAAFGQNELTAWFTPVEISVNNGVVTYSRMDMLLGDDYQVATWGVLNLADQPRQVDGKTIPAQHGRMILGIDERALRNVYGITQWITEPNYVDQFVMEGKLETLGPDTTDLLGRLTLLTAEGTAGAVAGKAGDIIGIVRKTLSKADRALLNRKFDPAPPPKPFPWGEEEYTEEEQKLIQKRTNGDQAQPTQPDTQPTTDAPKKDKEPSDEEKLKKALEKGLKDLFK